MKNALEYMPKTSPFIENREHFVYRLFDADDQLLYVGLTYDLKKRLQQHRRKAKWWHSAAHGTAVLYPGLFAARRAETIALQTEGPAFNVLKRSDQDVRVTDQVTVTDPVTTPRMYRALAEMVIDQASLRAVTDSASSSALKDTHGRAHPARPKQRSLRSLLSLPGAP